MVVLELGEVVQPEIAGDHDKKVVAGKIAEAELGANEQDGERCDRGNRRG